MTESDRKLYDALLVAHAVRLGVEWAAPEEPNVAPDSP